jgi:hypothetical protein
MYVDRKELVISVAGALIVRQMEGIVVAANNKNNAEPNASGEDFTDRVLMTFSVDLTLIHETVEQLTVKVHALLKERGLPAPK